MKRLLQISFNTLLNSLLPIIMWILLGKIVDSNLVHIFTITYSFQFVMTLFVYIFGKGANITFEKDQQNEIVDNNIFLGTILSFVVTLIFCLYVDQYISFLNLDPSLYHTYTIYAFILMFFQAVLRIICEKLYFKNENKTANELTLLFNIINLLSILSLVLTVDWVTISLTLVFDAILIIILLVKYIDSLSFKFSIRKNINYVSGDLLDSLGFFIIYIIGQRTTFEFGNLYLIAMNFTTLITDMQWDVSYAVNSAATIDASKNKLNYKQSIANARKLTILLLFSIFIMGAVLYFSYKPSLWITALFLGTQIIDLCFSPKIWIRQQFIHINYSSEKNAFHRKIYALIRIIFSFVPTPFCTYLGQLVALFYEILVYDIYYNKKFYIKNNYLSIKD